MTGALLGIGSDRGALVGQIAVLGTTVSQALAAVYARRFRALPSFTTAVRQFSGATHWLLPVALVVDRPWKRGLSGAEAVAAITCLALVSSALACVLFYRMLAVVRLTHVAPVPFLVPIGALLLGAALLDERIGSGPVLGTAVNFLGRWCVEGRLPAAARRHAGRASSRFTSSVAARATVSSSCGSSVCRTK